MNRLSALILLIATIIFVTAPLYTPPFTGYDSGEFPVSIPDPAVQPAPYAFSIWGVIYAWLLVHAGFGLWRRTRDCDWARVRAPLTVAVALGALWLGIAGASSDWAAAVIWVMTIAALTAFLQAPTEQDRWLLSAPLAMFAGWLTAATAVSTGILLGGYDVVGDTEAALAMLALVLVVALVVQSRKPRMPIYGLTIIWALVGVIVTNWPGNMVVAGAAGAGIVVMLAALIVFARSVGLDARARSQTL
jgi:hypothetical protein